MINRCGGTQKWVVTLTGLTERLYGIQGSASTRMTGNIKHILEPTDGAVDRDYRADSGMKGHSFELILSTNENTNASFITK